MAKPQPFGDNWDSLCNDHDANHSVKLWLSARLRSYQRGCVGVESAHTKELPKGRHLGCKFESNSGVCCSGPAAS